MASKVQAAEPTAHIHAVRRIGSPYGLGSRRDARIEHFMRGAGVRVRTNTGVLHCVQDDGAKRAIVGAVTLVGQSI